MDTTVDLLQVCEQSELIVPPWLFWLYPLFPTDVPGPRTTDVIAFPALYSRGCEAHRFWRGGEQAILRWILARFAEVIILPWFIRTCQRASASPGLCRQNTAALRDLAVVGRQLWRVLAGRQTFQILRHMLRFKWFYRRTLGPGWLKFTHSQDGESHIDPVCKWSDHSNRIISGAWFVVRLF